MSFSSSSSSSSSLSPIRSPSLRRFTHYQVNAKVLSRAPSLPGYEALLFSCAVQQDEEGVTFDTSLPQWNRLVRMCAQADAKAAASASVSASSGPASGSSSSLLSRMGRMGTRIRSPPPSSPLLIDSTSPLPLHPPVSSTPLVIPSAYPPTVPLRVVTRSSLRRLNKSSSREMKDASFVQQDVAFESRLGMEMCADDDQIASDWRSRRAHELERENSLKAAEAEEENERARHGLKRKRRLVLTPPPSLLDENGQVIDELDYMNVLLRLLSTTDWNKLDVDRLRNLIRVTGCPAKYRLRLWQFFLGVTVQGAPEFDLKDDNDESATSRLPDEESSSSSILPSKANEANETKSVPNSRSDSPYAGDFMSPSLVEEEDEVIQSSSSDNRTGNGSPSPTPSESPPIVDSAVDSSRSADVYNHRVIKVDLNRTLPHLKTLQKPYVRDAMKQLLIDYCADQKQPYVQGMNYLLAPFLFLAPSAALRTRRYCSILLELYIAFIRAMLPNTFSDDDFGSLQCIFLLFRHLLLYHDPMLVKTLDASEIGPELFASSWFITLHANRCKLEVTLAFWDNLLIELRSHSRMHYYVSLSLIIAHRTDVLNEMHSNLPETLNHITMQSRRDVQILSQRARLVYAMHTPLSFEDRLQTMTRSKSIPVDSPDFILLSKTPCVIITARELCHVIVSHSTDKIKSLDSVDNSSNVSSFSQQSMSFFVLDCRSIEDFNAGHLPASLHLDPQLITDDPRRAEELEKRLIAIASMRGRHLCLVDDNGDWSSEQGVLMTWLGLLLSRNLRYISFVEGGYSACHALILRLDRSSELIDHSPALCLDCNGRAEHKRERKGLLANMRKLGESFLRTQGSNDSDSHNEDLRRDSVPQNVSILPNFNQMRLLLTTVRNREADDIAFVDTLNRLSTILFGAILEKLPMREKQVKTAAGGLYTGVESSRAVICIYLHEYVLPLIENSWRPYHHLVSMTTVRANINKHGHCELPAMEQETNNSILLFMPVLDERAQVDAMVLLSHLQARGITAANLTLLSVIAARPALWSLDDIVGGINAIVAGVDELKVLKYFVPHQAEHNDNGRSAATVSSLSIPSSTLEVKQSEVPLLVPGVWDLQRRLELNAN